MFRFFAFMVHTVLGAAHGVKPEDDMGYSLPGRRFVVEHGGADRILSADVSVYRPSAIIGHPLFVSRGPRFPESA